MRHGDVSALADVYGNRRVYKFDAYIKEAARLAASPPGGITPPAALFVASDDENTTSAAMTALAHWSAAPGKSSSKGSVLPPTPRLITLPVGARYVTPHGSHTAASEGGCVRDACALHAKDVLHYRAVGASMGERQADRIMRVLMESIEDLYLLSLGDALVTQESSHFSTMAALLMWARNGAAAAPGSVAYVDGAAVREGIVQCAYLHGALNRTAAVPRGRGGERWESHKRRFMEALGEDGADPLPHLGLSAHVFGIGGPFGIVDGLPAMPGVVFDNEVRRWIARPDIAPRVPWTGECPLKPPAGDDAASLLAYTTALINHGATHHDMHPGQSIRCWQAAIEALSQCASAGGTPIEPNTIDQIDEVIRGNLRAVAADHMFPYSMKPEEVCRFMRRNFGAAHAGCRSSNSN